MKKFILLIIILILTLSLSGCGLLPESRLTNIRVEPHKITLSVGNEQPLVVTAYYSDNTETEVTLNCVYELNNVEIATVSDEGLIKAIKVGNAIILVTYTEYNFWTGKIIKIHWVILTVK